MKSKIFGIGLSKTGTKSLNQALNILGYSSVHYPALNSVHEIFRTSEAATDISIAYLFKELDYLYPNSKFILTTRDTRSWLVSIRRHIIRQRGEDPWRNTLHLGLYGSTEWDVRSFQLHFHLHQGRVIEHFENRGQDLLIFDICKGEGWQELCHFLEKPVPDCPFPHVRKANTKGESIKVCSTF